MRTKKIDKNQLKPKKTTQLPADVRTIQKGGPKPVPVKKSNEDVDRDIDRTVAAIQNKNKPAKIATVRLTIDFPALKHQDLKDRVHEVRADSIKDYFIDLYEKDVKKK